MISDAIFEQAASQHTGRNYEPLISSKQPKRKLRGTSQATRHSIDSIIETRELERSFKLECY